MIYTFLKTPTFRFVTLSLENKLSPLEILQNCLTLLGGNSKVKNLYQCHFEQVTTAQSCFLHLGRVKDI